MIWLLWFVPCAFANRIRGGWYADQIKKFFPCWSTNIARLFFSFVISLPLFFNRSCLQYTLFLLLFFFGLIFRWGPWQYMNNPKKDIYSLGLRGLILTFPCGIAGSLYLFAFSGALMGACYWIPHSCVFYYKQPDGYVWSWSDWGEVFFGALLGFTLGVNIALFH